MSNLPVTPTQPASYGAPSSRQYDSAPIQIKLASGSLGESRTHDSNDPLLKIDLANAIYEIPLDKFVDNFLGLPPSDMSSLQKAFEILGEEKEITDAVNAYIDATDELALYAPFAKITNHILARVPIIRPDLPSFPVDLIFVRNDLTLIRSPNGSRKPDVVGVSKRRIETLWEEYKGRENPSAPETPPNVRWVDICLPIELKHSSTAKFNISDFNKTPFPPPPYSTSTTISGPYPPPSTSTTASGHFKRKAEGPADAPGAKKRMLSRDSDPLLREPTAVMSQSVGCAAELMTSTGGTRVHAWGISIVDSNMQLSIYDASCVMHAASFDFLSEFPTFAAIIVTMASFDRERWGVQTAVNYPPSEDTIPVSLEGSTLSFETGEVVTIGKEISSRYGLIGRNTNVHEGDCKGITHKVAVKFSQPLQSRAWSEWDIIQHAKKHNVQGIPEVRGFRQFETLCSRLRRKVFGLEDSEDSEDSEAPYEKRWMAILVSKLYHPLYELSGDTYLKPFQEAVRCHQDLFKLARILHRDISIGNLMHDVRDNFHYGIVNDYDNAIILDEEGNPQAPPSKHPTGTIPFMAFELLGPDRPVRHLYRHDLESFFYVIIWTAVFFPHEKRSKTSVATLSKWCSGDAERRFSAKYANVMDLGMVASLTFTDSFHKLKSVAEELHYHVYSEQDDLNRYIYQKKRDSKRVDATTHDDVLTFAQFDDILTRALATSSDSS